MLTLLAALLLSGPPAARAEGNPAAQTQTLDPADADGDGVVSGKERRRKRRADRRARKSGAGSHSAELETDVELDAAETTAEDAAASSKSAGAAAAGKATSAAAALKNSLPSTDGIGGVPGAGAPGRLPGGPAENTPSSGAGVAKTSSGELSSGASGDPGRPKAASDFVLAARSGYAPAFVSAGLKISPDGKSVVRLDGKPATPEDYARLQREIGAMPAALGRRPDFFSSVSPAHYADLKHDYKEKKDGPVYKDVGTTAEDRDFIHTASCSKLSGDCNKSVEKASYKKGDFVAPEDLDHMWDALQKELDGSAEGGAGGLPSLGATRSQVAREKALDAARALSPEHPDRPTGPSDAEAPAKAGGSTPVSQAVASVRRFWKSATAISAPGKGNAPGGGLDPRPIIGALALAAFGVGALFMRRKG